MQRGAVLTNKARRELYFDLQKWKLQKISQGRQPTPPSRDILRETGRLCCGQSQSRSRSIAVFKSDTTSFSNEGPLLPFKWKPTSASFEVPNVKTPGRSPKASRGLGIQKAVAQTTKHTFKILPLLPSIVLTLIAPISTSIIFLSCFYFWPVNLRKGSRGQRKIQMQSSAFEPRPRR